MRILRLLRSEWNVNAVTDAKETPLSILLDIRYHVIVAWEDFDRRGVESGRDFVWTHTGRGVALYRQVPLEILRCFATREKIQHYISNHPYGIVTGGRWELLLLYLSLGADIEQIHDRLSQWFWDDIKEVSPFPCFSDIVKEVPSFLREILSNKGRKFAPYEYLPQVYMALNKQPMSLQLCAAVRAKKLSKDLKPSEERKEWLALGLPPLLADGMVDLDKTIEQWGEQTTPKLTADEIDNLSW